MTDFRTAQRIADAVLWEGYVLYPYRASAVKNNVRWQFGVVAPRDQSQAEGSEPCRMQTECLVEPGDDPAVDVRVRFLQLQSRTVEEATDASGRDFRAVDALEVGDRRLVGWDEAVERMLDAEAVALADLSGTGRTVFLEVPGGRDVEPVAGPGGGTAGRVLRRRWPISGTVHVAAEPCGDALRLRVRVENHTPMPDAAAADRDTALRRSLLGAHTLLAVRGGAFVSLMDPPPWAAAAAAGCENTHTWPVLVGDEGDRDVMLSSPIILYDHPQVAPESQGDFFDATEIDELLTLRVMALTEEEKREARATDERARSIVDRADALPPELMDRLHGAIRYLGEPAPAQDETPAPDTGADDPFSPREPYWQPEARVPPDRASVRVGDTHVSKGARVRLRPGPRGDTMDLFLRGRTARVEGVFESLDDETFVAVVVEDDPAGELHGGAGRFMYFRPEELEPLPEAAEEPR